MLEIIEIVVVWSGQLLLLLSLFPCRLTQSRQLPRYRIVQQIATSLNARTVHMFCPVIVWNMELGIV